MFKNKSTGMKRGIKVLLVLASIAVVLAVLYFVLSRYTVNTVYVEGNLHYTTDEIKAIVMEGPFGSNSLYLSMKYKNKGVDDIPFIDAMDVKILAPDTIRITVYEKALAGYVLYLGRYMYFDKDGTIVESSDVKTVGIPQITGLTFEHIVVGKELPVGDNFIFNKILDVTQVLEKYQLVADRLYFNSAKKLTIYFGQVRVEVGEEGLSNEKAVLLQNLLPKLEGKSGVLKLSNEENIIFEHDEKNP